MSEMVRRAQAFREEVLDKAKLIDDVGGIVKERGQSDKVGSDWVRYYANGILVRTDYIAQETPQGTQENPIEYADSVPMIPNAYYTLEGVRKVWMGAYQETAAAWTDARLVVF